MVDGYTHPRVLRKEAARAENKGRVGAKERQEKTRGAKPLRSKELKGNRKQGRAGRRPDGQAERKTRGRRR